MAIYFPSEVIVNILVSYLVSEILNDKSNILIEKQKRKYIDISFQTK